MQAYQFDPTTPELLVKREVAEPQPLYNETVVKAYATSLNRGEVRFALKTSAFPSGHIFGWDVAGVVEQESADGKGPKVGTRVVGFMPQGCWAERVAVANATMAPIPDAVSFGEAATLPVAGLTALHALYRGGNLFGKRVLVTGATGGVGDFAIQLAKQSGAVVTAYIRSGNQRGYIERAGPDNIALGDHLGEAAQPYAPFDLVVESVGGRVLGDALGLLAERGEVVLFGTSGGNDTTFNAETFYGTGGATLFGLVMPSQLKWVESGTIGLTKLGQSIADGKLKPQISVEESWDHLPKVAHHLLERKFLGKAILHIAS